MALKSKVFKAELQVSDFGRNYYETHQLTLAQHPSETEERLMVRLLAFALHADAALALGRGLSSEEPDLWRKDLTGQIELTATGVVEQSGRFTAALQQFVRDRYRIR